MLPTIATTARPGDAGTTDRRVAQLLELDAQLFLPTWWRLLDAGNRRVPGIRFATPTEGLRMVAAGTAHAFMGRLRPGVVAVDVDVPDHVGYAITDLMCAWLDQLDRPYLIRPSGGSDGRAHIITIPGEHLDALTAYRDQLAQSFGVAAAKIDVRSGHRALRALSSPHRTTGQIPPLHSPPTAIVAFVAALADLEPIPTGPRRRPSQATQRPTAPAPAPARRRTGHARVDTDAHDDYTGPILSIPPAWTTYLRTGTIPQTAYDRQYAEDATAVEAVALGHILRSGLTCAQAWSLIQTAPPTVMPRARADQARFVALWNRESDDSTLFCASQDLARRGINHTDAARILTARSPALARIIAIRTADTTTGRRSWPHMWQRLVDRARTAKNRPATPPAPHSCTDTAICTAVEQQRRWLLEHALWQLPPLRRASRYLVADWILQRIHRTGALRVSCAQRLLHVDLGLDRATIASALAELEALGAFTLHRSYVAGSRQAQERSHEVELPPRSRETDSTTSCSHNPPRAGTLPAALHLLHASLSHTPNPRTPARLCLLTDLPSSPSTPAQERTASARLLDLSTRGLAETSEDGTWRALHTAQAPPSDQDKRARCAREASVLAERQSYAQRLSQRSHAWEVARREARIAQRAREHRWLARLPAAERARRSAAGRTRFSRLPLDQQLALKRRWVERDAAVGAPDEATRHARWRQRAESQPHFPDECARRSHEFSLLPRDAQARRAAAWAAWRRDHCIPSPTSDDRPQRAVLDSAAARDAAFLLDQARLPLFDELYAHRG